MNSDANIVAHLSTGPKVNGQQNLTGFVSFLPVSVDDLCSHPVLSVGQSLFWPKDVTFWFHNLQFLTLFWPINFLRFQLKCGMESIIIYSVRKQTDVGSLEIKQKVVYLRNAVWHILQIYWSILSVSLNERRWVKFIWRKFRISKTRWGYDIINALHNGDVLPP